MGSLIRRSRITVPPDGNVFTDSPWVAATVIDAGRNRNIRDPSDGSTQEMHWIRVKYDDGVERSFDRIVLDARRPTEEG